MTQALAYEIGAVFLVTALLMGGSLARGLFSKDILRGVRLFAIAFGLLAVSAEAYRRLPGTVGGFFLTPTGTTAAPPGALPKAGDKEPVPRQPARRPHPAARPQPTPKVIDVDSLLKTEVKEPPVEIEETPNADATLIAVTDTPKPQASENKTKRAIKSVGHFLHLSHKKYEPPHAAPQP
jgi:hypothetical protein